MYTIEDIRTQIHPVPQKVTGLEGAGLKLQPASKVCFTAPEAEKGPIKTAAAEMKAYLTAKLGDNCFCDCGTPVTLKLSEKPEEVKSEQEGYRLTVNAEGVTIEGFGANGLYYGVISFKQICDWTSDGLELPAVEILDWPDNPFRAYKEECRYGSNMMEKADWFQMIDDLASKKLNQLSLAIYGCWTIQYDGRLAEYLYVPLKDYPQLKTPQTVKYYSPSEGKWLNYEQLPPIFRDNFLGELIVYAKDRGINVIPGINSFGHNTLFPRMIKEVAPVNDAGEPQPTGFCTSSEETYKLLFSAYDQIIDEYLLPNEIYTFNILLDEVWEQYVDTNDMYTLKTPWCRCEKCRDKERSEIFIEHAIKLLKHLKEKGMKSIVMANDMVARKVSKLGDISAAFLGRIREEGLEDVLFFDWWWYHDQKAKLDFVVEPDELGFRSFFCSWNGYYIWDILQSPMKNSQIMAEMNHNAKCGEGIYLYSMWDKSYDRVHDCFADYGWNYVATGETDDCTKRYVARHFGPMQRDALHAYKLLDWISEERKEVLDKENGLATILSPLTTLRKLSYYLYCYFNSKREYPREFPGNALDGVILPVRADMERFMYTVAAMAKEAKAIFEKAAVTPGCDQEMARRMVYECHNYIVLMEDWEAFLEIYDLTQGGDQKKIAPIARARQQARLALMLHCEQTKEEWVCKAATMRNQSVFMQIFADIANYIENADQPQLDLLNIKPICSKENLMLR